MTLASTCKSFSNGTLEFGSSRMGILPLNIEKIKKWDGKTIIHSNILGIL